MKVRNLLANTLAGCLLMGASGAAMAVGCPTGSIIGGVVSEIVIEGTGADCTVVNAKISIADNQLVVVAPGLRAVLEEIQESV